MKRDPTRPRLCIVNPFEHGGGAEYQIAQLIDVLATQDRFEIYYLAHHLSAEIGRRRYRPVRVGSGDRPPRFGYLMDAMPLYRELRRIAPAAIYQRVAGGYTGICAHYARRHGARLIWHVAHDYDVSRDSSMHGRNPLRRFLEKRSIEYGIRHATRIVTQTRSQSAQLFANYGRRADAVIANFHPLPAERLLKAPGRQVLWIANLKPGKRPEAFVRLAAALRDLDDVRFLMIGAPAVAEDSRWTAALSQALAMAPNIECLGKLTQEQVNGLLAQAHLLVSTSSKEGFPNTFIQAWMRQVPVVSLDVDPDGVLESERVGIAVRSEQELAAAVRRLITNPALREEYAERAQAYAIRHHSLHNAERLARLLSDDHADPAVDQ